ncbi:MAG: hypothetical protein JNM66_12315 [Bryobacterales bacterium]|nr:hypothetical protein [Bryobacterales bacterium]
MNTQNECEQRGFIGPIMMILVGFIFLVNQFVPEIGFDKLWPLILIGGGAAALFGRR